MFTPSRSLRSALSVTLVAAFALAGGLQAVSAQGTTTVAQVYDIGLDHVKAAPYNFTGRLFILDDNIIGFGTATLVRRHTALTAGHVIFDPVTLGFTTNATFSRALYKNYTLSQAQVAQATALSGYQTAVVNNAAGESSTAAIQRDQAYVLFTTPPVDENWGTYSTNASLLTDSSVAHFLIGYPGEGTAPGGGAFDGRTMGYVVPPTSFVQFGTGNTGAYSNADFTAIAGMSGGPLYAVPSTGAQANQQIIVGSLFGGIDDPSGEFNQTIIRGLTKESGKFLAAAEYNAGLIKKVKVKGPTTVAAGSTVTYTATVKFQQLNVLTGGVASTDRYQELKLKTDVPGTATNPSITVAKVANNQFQVTFNKSLRSGTRLNLYAQYDANLPAPKSTLTVTVR